MKFLNKNAYVQTAIFGTSFCKSSRQAFYLVVRNAARVGAISSVSSAVLFVGKLFISTVTTGLAYYVMTEQISDELYSVGGPTLVVFLISYFVSDFFMDSKLSSRHWLTFCRYESHHFSFVQSTTWELQPYCTALLQTKKCLMETSAMRQASYKHGSTRMPVRSRRHRTMLTR